MNNTSLSLLGTSSFISTIKTISECVDPRQFVRMSSQHLLEKLAVTGPPIDTAALLERYGLHTVEWKIPSEGFLTTASRLRAHAAQFPWVGEIPDHLRNSDADDPVIVVRRLPSVATASQRRRQRFVKVHEFAHWYLREQIYLKLGRVELAHNDPEEEMLCNLMAADILVPSTLLAEDVAEPGSLAANAMNLTDKYDVNLSTLLVKAASLIEGFAAFAVFGWRDSDAHICFTTPARSEAVFRDDTLYRDVVRAFSQKRTQHTSYSLRVRGRTRELGAFHQPTVDHRQVLSLVYAVPFTSRCVSVSN